jgi:hypothetical protein
MGEKAERVIGTVRCNFRDCLRKQTHAREENNDKGQAHAEIDFVAIVVEGISLFSSGWVTDVSCKEAKQSIE